MEDRAHPQLRDKAELMALNRDVIRVKPGLGNSLHFPQLDEHGLCIKQMRDTKTGRGHRRIQCRQTRDGDRHLYYPCLRPKCHDKFWSLDSRLQHMENKHGRILMDQVQPRRHGNRMSS